MTPEINFLWALLSLPVSLVSFYYKLFKSKPKVDLENKVVFISGASSGIGKACAEVFFKAGCRLVLSGRKQDTLQNVKDALLSQMKERQSDIALVVMDCENLASIPAKVAEATACFGHVDIVINNAGISCRGEAIDTDISVYQKIMTVNFFSHVQVTKCFLPQMIERKSGHIVVTGSVQGPLAIPYRTAYGASKHAVEGYFDSLRAEMAQYNVDVSILNPFYVRTNISLTAVCGDGSPYGKMDETIEKGLSPSYVAEQMKECVVGHVEKRLVCPLYVKLAVILRTMVPDLYCRVMEHKAKKDYLALKKSGEVRNTRD